jgi:hypothetical protein
MEQVVPLKKVTQLVKEEPYMPSAEHVVLRLPNKVILSACHGVWDSRQLTVLSQEMLIAELGWWDYVNACHDSLS